MSRVQLALNVSDLDAARSTSTRSSSPPHQPEAAARCANFAIDRPALKLVLIEGHGEPGTLNHLGVEVETADEVNGAAASRR